jgi:hypothetical protein
LCCFESDGINQNLTDRGFVASSDLDTLFLDDRPQLTGSIQLFDFTIEEDFLMEHENLGILGNIGENLDNF